MKKLLKLFGLMKIKDAETIAAAVAIRALQDVKAYIRDEAPDIYQRWDKEADQKRGNWARQAFRDAHNTEASGPFAEDPDAALLESLTYWPSPEQNNERKPQ